MFKVHRGASSMFLTWSKSKYGKRFPCGGHRGYYRATLTKVLGEDGDSGEESKTVAQS